MIDTVQLIEGKSSEDLTIEKPRRGEITRIKRVLDSLPAGSARAAMLVFQLFQQQYPQYCKAIWSGKDIRKIMMDFDLSACLREEYVGYCDPKIEEEIAEISGFVDEHEEDCCLMYLTDRKNIKRNASTDPFVLLAPTLEGERLITRLYQYYKDNPRKIMTIREEDDIFILTHKFGPDVTEERKQIVKMRKEREMEQTKKKKGLFR